MTRLKCIFLPIGIALLLSGDTAMAQGPPIFSDTPVMLGLEGRGIRTFGHYVSKENAQAYTHIIAFPYNITSKWQVGGIVPLVNRSPEGRDSRFGLGDVKIFTKYQLHQTDGRGETFRTLIKVTQSFPTGDASEIPALGSGAYQTSVGLVTGYVTTEYAVYGEVAYNAISDGLPDNLLYNVAFGYPLLPQHYPPKQINLFLELNGNLVTDNSSNRLFISPGIQYIAGKRVLVETGIQVPLIEDVPSDQKTNFRYLLGVRVLIF